MAEKFGSFARDVQVVGEIATYPLPRLPVDSQTMVEMCA